MKKTLFTPSVAILSMCLAMTSCSQAVTEEVVPASLPEESVTETTVEPFEPILITEDYDGPILGVENWHIESSTYWNQFINNDTGEAFAECIGNDEYYLADLNGDGEPELVCLEKWGLQWNDHTEVYKLEDGVILHADICLGNDVLGNGYYPEFAKIYGLEINSMNYLDYSDTYDPERNMIIVTDSSTGTEYVMISFVVSAPLMYGIAKIGCFMTGCCHGKEYFGPLAVTYHNKYEGTYFPIQIVESVIYILIFVISLLLAFKMKNKIQVIAIIFAIMLPVRFVTEYFRYYNEGTIISPEQILVLIAAFVAATLVIIQHIIYKHSSGIFK